MTHRLRNSHTSSLFTLALFLCSCILFHSAQTALAAPFINEIHYDNNGTDIGEAIELAGLAGTDLSGWSIVLYNGLNGSAYESETLSGIIPDQQNGYGVLSFSVGGIQNGAPDGIALIDPSSMVIQFLSYEGAFVAADGPADGMTSTDIGVSEPGDTPLGYSLQLTGTGFEYADFVWCQPSPDSFGYINTGQTFETGSAPVPLPPSVLLLGSGLLGVTVSGRRFGKK